MKTIIFKYKKYCFNKDFAITLFTSVFFILASLVVNFYAGVFATTHASNYVNDIVLSNIRVYDVDTIFIYGPFVLWAFVGFLCLIEPKRIPFVLKSITLFVLIRSLFIILTHIGPFPDQIIINYPEDVIGKFTFGGDLFFSAHTGLPFLMALVFGKNKKLRILFTLTAIFFGVIVLLAHLHYSIDVLSAFFITYTIFHMAKYLFKKEWEMFSEEI